MHSAAPSSFRIAKRADTRTKPVFYDSRDWLRDRRGYKNIDPSEFTRPERWEGDVEISLYQSFVIINGEHARIEDKGLIDG
jgi:hypothetical protein